MIGFGPSWTAFNLKALNLPFLLSFSAEIRQFCCSERKYVYSIFLYFSPCDLCRNPRQKFAAAGERKYDCAQDYRMCSFLLLVLEIS